MHVGLVMECDYRDGVTQEQAFDEAFDMMDVAETGGLDAVWLAERHFAGPRRPLDPFGGGLPSVASVPLIWASAIAARTSRLRIGIGVSVLPLCHPIRMAEEAATVDQISKGRLEFGVGRSGFARAYKGYAVPYAESRERFQECFDIILKAWTEERFSYTGKHYTFEDVCVIPKPYQKPLPPIRIAATTQDTFPQVGRMGYPLLVGLRGFDVPEVAGHLQTYRQAWQEAGHPGNGDVILRIPVYVAKTAEQARSEPEVSTMSAYRRMADTFSKSAQDSGTTASEDRTERGERLGQVTYDGLLRDRLAYGTPDEVAARLLQLRDELGLSGFIIEPNVGGRVEPALVLDSIRLFGKEAVPQLRGA